MLEGGHADRGIGRDRGIAAVTMQPAIRRRAPRAAALPSTAGVPTWMRRLSAIALGCAALGLALLIVSLAEFIEGSTARPLAVVLITFAAACGLAALVARPGPPPLPPPLCLADH